MNRKSTGSLDCQAALHNRNAIKGFTLIELMVAITLGLFITIALMAILLNVNRTNRETAATSSQIENGRFAIQILENDIVHAGFWGGYNPQYDDLTATAVPSDAPSAIPDPCLSYSVGNWSTAYKSNLIGIPVDANDAAPGSCAGVVANQQASTDVLVVRHAETCIPGIGNCAAEVSGKLYLQPSFCSATAQIGTSTSITLALSASSTSSFYQNLTIRTINGTGSGQSRTITAYDGATKVATISPAWTTIPDNTTTYTLGGGDYVLDTLAAPDTVPSKFPLFNLNCLTAASKRKFVSSIYYVRNYSAAVGDGIPTLVRSRFDPDGVAAALAHQAADPLVDGVEGFRVEFGIDNLSKTGAAVNYAQAVTWADATNKITPTNRGNGAADGGFVRCTTAAPCTVAQLMNVVVVKLYVLVRSLEKTSAYKNTKTYCLGTPNTDGTCLAGNTFGPYDDGFQRHIYASTVRLNNVSGRRETPP